MIIKIDRHYFYSINGFNRFKNFLQSIDSAAEFIVVCNGKVFDLMNYRYKNVIQGSNEAREFSGWECGLKHAEASGMDLSKYIVIFANDTFCHHNNFGIFSRYAFRKSFGKMTVDSKCHAISGEVWPFNSVFEVDGVESDCWVATYLFALPGATLMKIGGMHPTLPFDRFYSNDENKLTYSELLSSNLANHLDRWFSDRSSASWKNKANLDTSSTENFKGKANSIICEKYISAKVKSVGGVIIDVFNNKWIRLLRRFETLHYKLFDSKR